jgi:Family of unknown function (DUF6941)
MPERRPTLQFSFPCDRVVEDTGGGVSVERIVDGFTVRRPDSANPLSFFQLNILNGWCDGEGLHEDWVVISRESSEDVVETKKQEFILQSPQHRALNLHHIGLQLQEEGDYRVRVFGDGEEVMSYPIQIRFREKQRS